MSQTGHEPVGVKDNGRTEAAWRVVHALRRVFKTLAADAEAAEQPNPVDGIEIRMDLAVDYDDDGNQLLAEVAKYSRKYREQLVVIIAENEDCEYTSSDEFMDAVQTAFDAQFGEGEVYLDTCSGGVTQVRRD